MQIQISWLLQKPTDLNIHCLQRQDISGFSRTRGLDQSQQKQIIPNFMFFCCFFSSVILFEMSDWPDWYLDEKKKSYFTMKNESPSNEYQQPLLCWKKNKLSGWKKYFIESCFLPIATNLFTINIRTPWLPTILALNFEQVYLTTCWCL